MLQWGMTYNNAMQYSCNRTGTCQGETSQSHSHPTPTCLLNLSVASPSTAVLDSILIFRCTSFVAIFWREGYSKRLLEKEGSFQFNVPHWHWSLSWLLQNLWHNFEKVDGNCWRDRQYLILLYLFMFPSSEENKSCAAMNHKTIKYIQNVM